MQHQLGTTPHFPFPPAAAEPETTRRLFIIFTTSVVLCSVSYSLSRLGRPTCPFSSVGMHCYHPQSYATIVSSLSPRGWKVTFFYPLGPAPKYKGAVRGPQATLLSLSCGRNKPPFATIEASTCPFVEGRFGVACELETGSTRPLARWN